MRQLCHLALVVGLGLTVGMGVGCRAPGTATRSQDPTAEGAATASLLELGDQALARGELETAGARYQRALATQPGAVRPRVGLAWVAVGLGQWEAARQRANEALALEPDNAHALVVLAQVERLDGHEDRARELLWHALQVDPRLPRAHTLLAALTGPAPRRVILDARDAAALASAHPYDPWATLQAARALVDAREPELARDLLASHSWLAGRAPEAGFAGLRLLGTLDPEWANRRLVPVHCYADESVRREQGWAMRLQLLLAAASEAMLPILDTTFVPVRIEAFRSSRTSNGLEAIEAAFFASVRQLPSRGVLAVFTQREPPRRRGQVRLGQAEYLGRRLVVRLDHGSLESRTLLHEILHLYGGVHISDDIPSLMNPAGDAMTLDTVNQRIVRIVRPRRFGVGGFRQNVLPYVDSSRLSGALMAALGLNLHFRELDVQEALEARTTSRVDARRRLGAASQLDDQLGDASRFLGVLQQEQGRNARAVTFYEAAAALYGPDTQKAREARELADRLRAQLEDAGGGAGASPD